MDGEYPGVTVIAFDRCRFGDIDRRRVYGRGCGWRCAIGGVVNRGRGMKRRGIRIDADHLGAIIGSGIWSKVRRQRRSAPLMRRQRYLPDRIVALIAEIDIPCTIDSNGPGLELSLRCRALVSAVPEHAGTGNRADHARAGRYLANSRVIGIGDVNIAGVIDGNGFGIIQARAGSRAAVAAIACESISRNCIDNPGPGCNLPNALAVGLADVEVARAVDGDLVWRDFRAGCRAAVATISAESVPSYRSYDACRGRYFAHRAYAVGDINVSTAVDRNTNWLTNPCAGCGTTIPRDKAAAKRTGDRLYDAGCGRYLSEDAVTRIGNIEVVCAVDSYGLREVQLCAVCWTSIPAISGGSSPGDGGDDAIDYRYFADDTGVRVGDVDISRAIDGYGPRAGQFRSGGDSSISGVPEVSVTCDGDDFRRRDSGDGIALLKPLRTADTPLQPRSP